jgi:hypothetical protein
VGVSVALANSWEKLSFDRDGALDGGSATVAQAGYENPAWAQRIRVRTGGIGAPSGISTGFGILVRPVDKLALGASWTRMFPLFTETGSFGGAVDVGADVASARASCGGPPSCGGGAAIGYDVPDVWALGARLQLPRNLEASAWLRVVVYGGYSASPVRDLVVQLSGDATTETGAPPRMVLARALRPTVAGELGLRWRPLAWLRVGASLVAESSAIPSELVNAEAIDAPKLDLMLGAEWRLRWFRVTFAYGFTGRFLFGTQGSGFDPGATVRCVDARYAIDACTDALAGRGLPAAAGSYSLYTHRFSLGLAFQYD